MRLLLALALALPLAAQSWRVDAGWGPQPDKGLHFLVGGFVAVPPYCLALKLGYKHPWLHALAWSLLAGLTKEIHDRRKGFHPDPADVAYTGLGGLSVGLVLWRQDRDRVEFATAPKLEESR